MRESGYYAVLTHGSFGVNPHLLNGYAVSSQHFFDLDNLGT